MRDHPGRSAGGDAEEMHLLVSSRRSADLALVLWEWPWEVHERRE
jgi:hypothetical protein